MSDTNPLGNLFLETCARNAQSVALRSTGRDMSYATLRGLVIKFALHLREHKVGPKALVAVNFKDNPLMSTVAVLANTLVGARWLQGERQISNQPSLRITHILHNNPDRPSTGNTLYVDSGWYESPENYSSQKQIIFPGYESEDSTWFIAKSSGTTGTAKYLPISSRMFHQRILSLCELPETHAPIKVFDLFNRASNLACLHLLHTLQQGGTYVLAYDYEFLASQELTRLIASPVHLAEFLRGVPAPKKPGVYEVRVVGGAIQAKFLAKLLQYFQMVTTTYGSTEAGPTTYRRITEYNTDGSVGELYPGVQLEVVDTKQRPVNPGVEGEVRIKTVGQITEYVDNVEASKEAFRDGWFYPGDRGIYSAEGKLYIVGRIKDQLNVGGLKIHAGLIDQAIQDSDNITDGMCFVETDEEGNGALSALVSIESGVDVHAVLRSVSMNILAREKDRHRLPGSYYVVDKVPRNPNGKVMRHQAMEVIKGLKPIVVVQGSNSDGKG
jgi:acyl-coenzyme A synthetase/AMP-(fatty) acid ligase